MIKNMAAVTVLMAFMTVLWTGTAMAGESDTLVDGAQLLSQDTVPGTENLLSLIGAVEKVDVNRTEAIITIDDGNGSQEISLGYGDLLSDKRTAGVGYFSGAAVALGVLSRILRSLRGILSALGR